MAKAKVYQVLGCEITIEEAAKVAGVSTSAVCQQLRKLGGSMEMVLRLYEGRYGGVLARLEELKQDKEEDRKMSRAEGHSSAAKDEAAKEQILNILFDDKEGAKRLAASTPAVPPRSCGQAERRPEPTNAADVPVETVADEPETVPTEETIGELTEEPAPLAMEIEEVKPDRGALKLLNDAIESLERLSESGWEMSAKVRRDATAMVEGWKNERLLHFKDLIDWRALEG